MKNLFYKKPIGNDLRIFGYVLMSSGIISMLYSGYNDLASGVAVSFFLTFLGFAFVFPSLLEGTKGLSTMRTVVFMIINIIGMLLLKIGWPNGIHSLREIGFDGWWMGTIAVVFGAKVVQSYFESKKPASEIISRTGMAAVNYSKADIARLAVVQNEQFLKTKFPNIVSVSDAVDNINEAESHVVTLYLRDDATEGLPGKLEILMPDGKIKTISTEIIEGAGKGRIHINQKDEISNGDASGSICCIVKTGKGEKKVATAGHVLSNGYSDSFGGELDKSQKFPALINKSGIGNWFFQVIDYKNDLALANIEQWTHDLHCLSFENHYDVQEKDVQKTKVVVVSNVSQPQEREAYIVDYNTGWDVRYNDKTVTKNGIVLIGSSPIRKESQTVSRAGDSGGCVYEPQTGALVGLILGGNDRFTWVLPLKKTFEYYNYKLS